jgi:hypothetical protein
LSSGYFHVPTHRAYVNKLAARGLDLRGCPRRLITKALTSRTDAVDRFRRYTRTFLGMRLAGPCLFPFSLAVARADGTSIIP